MKKQYWGLCAAVLSFSVLFGSPASALIIGAGQSATIDFDFSASQAAIDAAPQPLTLSFELTTSGTDQFDDPAGLFSFQYLDIGVLPVVNIGYDATGGVTSLGILSFSVATTDLVGSLRISPLTESIDLIGATFFAQDFNGDSLVSLTSLSLPQQVDVQIPAPSAALILLGGAFALLRRRSR